MSKLRVPVNQDDHIQGNENAPIELVEYGDYQCSFCGQAYPEVKAIQAKLGNDLKFIFRNFPITEIHHDAKNAALAAEAAAAQGKFWEMHDMLFENQKNLKEDDLLRYAEQIGLDIEKFKDDLKNRTYLDKVEKDFESGIRSGVNSTPSFYVNGEKQEDFNKQKILEYARTVHS